MFALFLETALYIFVINLIFIVIGIEEVSAASIFKIAKEMLMCLNQYWFMAAYFIVYLLAPYINKLIDQLTETERINFFILLIVVNTLFSFLFGIGGLGEGHTAIQGMYLYILGRLCAEENEKIRKIISRKYLLLIYLIACIANGVLVCIFNMIGEYKRAWELFSYNNPLIVVAACVLSLLFIGMKMKSHMLKRLISNFAKHVLAIYLLTDYEPMRKFIFWPVVVTSKYSNSIILIVAIIVLYVAVVSIVCILIDCLMSKVYNAILVKK